LSDPEIQQAKKELKKKATELEEVESKITSCEELKRTLEAEMASPEIYSDREKLESLNRRYSELQAEEEELNKKWEQLAEQIENLQVGI